MSDKGQLAVTSPVIAVAGSTTGLRSAERRRSQLRGRVDVQRSLFLRQCRARVTPQQVGLPASSAARSRGLRREDVAALAGVSTSWYTWLEQGRSIKVSDDVLERVCIALRLNADERIYLFSLVQRRLPQLANGLPEVAPPEVSRLIEALPFPAVALNLRCDVLAWNQVNSILYRDYSQYPSAERNLLEILVLRAATPVNQDRMEVALSRLMSALRFDYSRCAGDAKFEALLLRLCTLSPLFNRLWRAPDFLIRSYGLHQFAHPRFGEVTFEHTSFIADGHPCIRVVLCKPHDEAARNSVAAVNEELAAATSARA